MAKELKRGRITGMTVKVKFPDGSFEDRYIPMEDVLSVKFEYDAEGAVEKIKLLTDAVNRKDLEEAVDAAHNGQAIVTAWPPKKAC